MTPVQLRKAVIAELKTRGIEVPPKSTAQQLVGHLEQITGVKCHFTNTWSDYLTAFLNPPKATGRYVPKFRPLSLSKLWGESMVRAQRDQPKVVGLR